MRSISCKFLASFGISIAGLFRFRLLFVLIPSSNLRERLIWILEGLGGQAGCHMYWALGSRRSLFGCLFCVRWVLLGGVT